MSKFVLMNKKPGNLSLPELAARYNIKDIYGATIAYFSSVESGRFDLRACSDRICCYEVHLIRSGRAMIIIDDNQYLLGPGSLLILTPFQPAKCRFEEDVVSEGLLIDDNFYNSVHATNLETDAILPGQPSRFNTIYQLTMAQTEEMAGLLLQVRMAIKCNHIYKREMMRSMMHIIKLFVSELPFRNHSTTSDFRHKENIYKIFVHLASINFRQERQIQFYADKLNITTTYLSRIVKEVSGNTVGDHLTRYVFHEACNMLKSSDENITAIAFDLGFKDQSAFTNFFKLHAHCTPKDYRMDKELKTTPLE